VSGTNPSISVELSATWEKFAAGYKQAFTGIETAAKAASEKVEKAFNTRSSRGGRDSFREDLNMVAGALDGINAAVNIFSGEWDKAYAQVERIPFGIGRIASSLRELVDTLGEATGLWESVSTIEAAGEASAQRQNKLIQQRIAELDKIDAARKRLRDEVKDDTRNAVNAAFNLQVTEYERAQDAMEEIRRSEEATARTLERQASEKAAEDMRSYSQFLSDRLSSLSDEASGLRDGIADAGRVSGRNFVTTVGTSFGQFRSGQPGGAMAVAEAMREQRDLTARLVEIEEEMLQLARVRERGWN
jgi:uncharacterized phage infection (PIP) family protein YhgE